MKNASRLVAISCSLALMIMIGCTKDYFNPDKIESAIENTTWSPEFAVPLVYASYSINDLLKKASEEAQQVVQTDNNNLVTLVYSNELVSATAENEFVINNQTFSNTLVSGQFVNNLPANDSIVYPPNATSQNFSAGQNNRIDSIRLKNGLLNLNVSSTYKHDVRLKISLPRFKNTNGEAFSKTIFLNYTASTPVQVSENLSLQGYTADLSDGGTTFNNYSITYEVTIIGQGNEILPTDEVTINGDLNALKFRALYGYIDASSFSTPVDSLKITIFEAAQGTGTFSVVNPSVKFTFQNSFGIPFVSSFNTLRGDNTNSGTSYDLSSNNDIPSPLPIQFPNFNEIGQVKTDSFTLDNQGVVDLINDQPGQLVYGVDVGTSTGAGQNCFILDTSRVRATAEVKIPLFGTANVFTLLDTIPVNLQGEESEEGIDLEFDVVKMTLKTIIKNEYPVDTRIQIYTVNDFGIVTDSLLATNTIIPSAQVNATNGEVVSPGFLNEDLVFDESRINNLDNLQNLIIAASATTANNASTNVKIYDFYTLDVKLGIKSKITTK